MSTMKYGLYVNAGGATLLVQPNDRAEAEENTAKVTFILPFGPERQFIETEESVRANYHPVLRCVRSKKSKAASCVEHGGLYANIKGKHVALALKDWGPSDEIIIRYYIVLPYRWEAHYVTEQEFLKRYPYPIKSSVLE